MSLKYRIQNTVLVALMSGLKLVPYTLRIRLGGAIMARLASPILGYPQRIRDNLQHVMPELSEADVERIVKAAPNNAGRAILELYSAPDFVKRAAQFQVSGEGHAPLMVALESKKPVLLVSGHIGNYDAIRGYLAGKGHQVGGLYRPLNNHYLNSHYLKTIAKIGSPLFERGRKGLSHLVRHLKGGNAVAILLDQRMVQGKALDFFGKPALTALSAAELAVKYDALLVPCYGIRQEDGTSFELIFEKPLKHTQPEEMTQKLNDSLEAQIRKNMGQWLWFHRRWKD